MAGGRFIIEMRSDEIDEKSLHEALKAIGQQKLTATFLTDVTRTAEPGLSAALDGTYANANEDQREHFLTDLRVALVRLPYLRVVSASSNNDVPYMILVAVQVTNIGAMLEAVKADVANVLDAEAIRGRKTARLVRDTLEGFEVLIAVMDDSGYFVTARLSVFMGEQRR